MSFTTVNPATGETLGTIPSLDEAARDALLTRVDREQRDWRLATLADRITFVQALGVSLQRHRERLADALTREMGKPIVAARAEVDKCIALCEQAPSLAQHALADDVLWTESDVTVSTRYDAFGTVLAIMPWNFPYWQALRFAVPALLAGNGVLIKPAHSVAGSATILDQCLREASQAASLNRAAYAPCYVAFVEQDAIDEIIADPRIHGVTLTGSERAGRHVARVAGAHLKKVVLELGGSDAFLVLADADVTRAATVAVAARTVNSGQSCIAAKRFIVCDAVYDAFIEQFCEGMRQFTVGDPRNEETQIGPIATSAVRDDLARQVRESIAQGARALVGGHTIDSAGFFFAPTVLVDVPLDAPAAREELFGPVAAVFRVSDTDEAIRLANASAYGLGASVWTSDTQLAERCVRELDVGMIFVNDMVVSDPRIPFGGIKHSGVGRELGLSGFREFTNQKSVKLRRLPPVPR